MPGSRGDIAIAKQSAFVDVGLKLGFTGSVADIARPAHEIRHRARRSIAIEYLDAQTAWRKIARHLGKRRGGRLREQAAWCLIALDRPADKIARAGIAHIDDKPRHD